MLLSDVNCNRRLGTSSIRGCLWLLPCLWLLVNSVSSNPSVNVSCCSGNATWYYATNCSDGSRIRLNCPFGTFLIDPDASESDNFTVIHENDTAYLLTQFDDKIPANKFCISRSLKTGGKIALTCFDENASVSISMWKYTLVCIMSIVSAVFLIATLAVYAILPELRELQDKVMMAAVTMLAISYTVLFIQHLRPSMQDERITCVTFGFILYFFFLSAFFWLNNVAFNIWRAVCFKNFRVKERSLFYAYYFWGWGVPACFLITSLTMHHVEGLHRLKPGFGDYGCWFGGRLQTWAYFYGPVAVLLMLNIIYLGLTSWRLWHQYRDYTGSKLRVLRFKCLLYMKLVLVMGIPWIFELLSFAVDTKIEEFWILTDLINGLQGLIIFLILVATRKRVRKLLAKKRPCGIAFPKSWAAYEDEECEAAHPEELELSQKE